MSAGARLMVMRFGGESIAAVLHRGAYAVFAFFDGAFGQTDCGELWQTGSEIDLYFDAQSINTVKSCAVDFGEHGRA